MIYQDDNGYWGCDYHCETCDADQYGYCWEDAFDDVDDDDYP
jgi:DNA repair photolyase